MGLDQTFAIGTVVALKSGGPNMTVTHLREHATSNVRVTWFDTYGLLHADSFPPDSLLRVGTVEEPQRPGPAS